MTPSQIKKLQAKHGLSEMQAMIDSGAVWKLKGKPVHDAFTYIQQGLCMYPKVMHRDIYGNLMPARQLLRPGQPGSYQFCADYWKQFKPK